MAVSLPAPKEKKPKQPKSSTLTGNKEKQRHVSEEPTSTDLARGERDTNTGGDSESMKRSRPSRVTDDEGAGGSASGAPESVSSVVDGGQVAATAAATKRRTASYWSTAERARFAQLFTEHGRNYQLLSELLGTKSEIQVRNYYRNNRSALGMAQDHPPGAHAMDSMSSHDEGGPDAVSSR